MNMKAKYLVGTVVQDIYLLYRTVNFSSFDVSIIIVFGSVSSASTILSTGSEGGMNMICERFRSVPVL